MKRCPSCQRTYTDDSLTFCLEDGSTLSSASADSNEPPATLIMSEPRVTSPAQPETFRPHPTPTRPAPPQPYNMPQPAWSPLMPPQTYPAATARQGRGAAITSLICAIAAFFMLVLCLVLGANRVNNELLGGIFVFSALVGLLGATLGIVAVVKTGK